MPAYSYVFNNPLHFTDEDGLYGNKCCTYYRKKCDSSGQTSTYYCTIAERICNTLQNDKTTTNREDCIRKCLQEKDSQQCGGDLSKQASTLQIAAAHAQCFAKCGLDPNKNPFTGDPQSDDPPGCE